MKKSIWILSIIVLCGCEAEPETGEDYDHNGSVESSQQIDSNDLKRDTITDLATNDLAGLEFPDEVMKPGTLVDGAIWKDKRGENFLVIFQVKEGEYFAEGFKSELQAYHYVREETGREATLLWELVDSSQAIYKTVDYQIHTMKVLDLNSDGLAESEFFYTIRPDGMDSVDLNFVMHIDTERLTVQGKYGYGSDGIEASACRMIPLDTDIHLNFKEHALQSYNSWIEEHQEN